MRYVLAFSAVGFAVLAAGCGSSHSGTSSATTYSVGGTISGLNGTIVLENNGADALSLSTNGSFAFPTTLKPNSTYAVTIETQPTDQSCSITSGNASGTLTASETSIAIQCVSLSAVTGQWMWVSGSNSVQAAGNYGTEGTPASTNVPGARRQAAAWTDANGNFWLFGGYGTAHVGGTVGMLNDLWKYAPPTSNSAGQWTWEAGSAALGTSPSYGTLGSAAASNDPGAREGAATWSDAGGNLWLFGGDSLSASGSGQSFEQLNDVWKFDASSAQWVWVAGSSTAGNAGSYGTQGVASHTNLPPARTGAITWSDGAGVFWLFGGAQLNANGGVAAVFNDLWSFNPQTLLWTWVGGASAANSPGSYGAEGTAAAGNLPPARLGGSAWVDANGNFWVFGGQGLGTGNISQQYGDLWEYNPGSSEWTWVAGSSAPNASGVYGTPGSGAAGDTPGARVSQVAWKDSAGNLWLFGGYGYDAQGDVGTLDDLWEYNLNTGLWSWANGPSTIGTRGVYGTQNTSAGSNLPGAREQAVGWAVTSGTFYLFGGYGFDANGSKQDLNDLWSYTPNP